MADKPVMFVGVKDAFWWIVGAEEAFKSEIYLRTER